MEAVQSQTSLQTCAHCETPNAKTARYCKSCGATLKPPALCPHCNAELEADEKVCRNCGTQLVGARPGPFGLSGAVSADVAGGDGAAQMASSGSADAAQMASSGSADAAQMASSGSADDAQMASSGSADAAQMASSGSADADRARLDTEAAKLRAPKRPTSNIVGNALLFVAFLMVFVVFMQVMTKDAPKEYNPFEGGPPPSKQTAASSGQTAADPNAMISGRVELASGLESGLGTLFIIVRTPGVASGPPIAVKRISNPSFPQSFSVSSADTMFKGVPFTGPYDVQVRLDRDGDPMSKSAGDLVTNRPASKVTPGGPEIVLTLDKRL